MFTTRMLTPESDTCFDSILDSQPCQDTLLTSFYISDNVSLIVRQQPERAKVVTKGKEKGRYRSSILDSLLVLGETRSGTGCKKT